MLVGISVNGELGSVLSTMNMMVPMQITMITTKRKKTRIFLKLAIIESITHHSQLRLIEKIAFLDYSRKMTLQ